MFSLKHTQVGDRTMSDVTLHTVKLRREMPQKPKIPLGDQIEYILDRVFRGERQNWGWSVGKKKSERGGGGAPWIGSVLLEFEKTGGRGRNNPETVESQWEKILTMISKTCRHTNFNKYPWHIVDEDAVQAPEEEVAGENEPVADETSPERVKDIKKELPPGVQEIMVPSKVLTLEDLAEIFPHELLTASDEEIESYDSFKGIYGRGPQIRSILGTIWSFIESNGERANHTLLYGEAGCAKTTLLLMLLSLFGEGAVLRLDSTNTTRAGLENLIFKKLKVVPPFVFMEEIEKANEETLKMWLGAMDERHEFRKVNYHVTLVRKVHFLGFGTANDKDKFDLMMGGRANKPGALSSRFRHQYECPRPDESQMRRILRRDIEDYGGKMEWIEPCIVLAGRLNTNDPRAVLSFLDGGDRLLDESYQKDQLYIYNKGDNS